jgi:hypothetical protein
MISLKMIRRKPNFSRAFFSAEVRMRVCCFYEEKQFCHFQTMTHDVLTQGFEQSKKHFSVFSSFFSLEIDISINLCHFTSGWQSIISFYSSNFSNQAHTQRLPTRKGKKRKSYSHSSCKLGKSSAAYIKQ